MSEMSFEEALERVRRREGGGGNGRLSGDEAVSAPELSARDRSSSEAARATANINAGIRTTEIALGSIYKGIAEMAGLPVDLVSGALSMAGINIDQPFLGTEHLKLVFNQMGLFGPDAETMAERLIERTGKEIGATLVPLGPVLGAARWGYRGGRFLRFLMEPARRAPGVFATTELTTAGASGLAAQGAREAVEPLTSSPELEAAAELTGAVAGGLTAGGMIGAGRMARSRLGAEGRQRANQATQRAGANQLQAAVPDPQRSIMRLEGRRQLEEAIPGFRATTAQIADEPGLRTLELELARLSPQLADDLARRQAANDKAFRDFLTTSAPPDVDPRAVRQSIQSRVNTVVGALDDRISGIEEKIRGLVDQGMPRDQAAELSNRLLREAEAEFQAKAAVLYESVDPTGSARVSVRELKALAQRLPKEAEVTEDLANLPTAIIADVKRLGTKQAKGGRGMATYNELKVLNSRLADEIAGELADPKGRRSRLRYLQTIKSEVQRTIDRFADTEQFGGVAERYRKANAYFAEGARIFREGPVRRVLKGGTSAVPESATLDYFIKRGRGGKEAANQFVRAVGGQAEARQAVRDFAVQNIYESSTNINGKLDPRRVREWLSKHNAALREFPEVRDELHNMALLQERIDVLGGRQKRVIGHVQRNAAALFLDDDPRQAVRAIRRSPRGNQDAMRLWRRVKDNPDARKGLRRALWDDMLAETTAPGRGKGLVTPFVDPQGLRRYLSENEQIFRAWGYSKGDLENLRLLADSAEVASRTSPPTAVTPRPEPSRLRFFNPATMWSRAFNVQKGVVSPEFVALETVSRTLQSAVGNMTDRQLIQTLEEALISPEFASDLLRAAGDGSQAAEAARQAHLHLITSGIVSNRPERRERGPGRGASILGPAPTESTQRVPSI